MTLLISPVLIDEVLDKMRMSACVRGGAQDRGKTFIDRKGLAEVRSAIIDQVLSSSTTRTFTFTSANFHGSNSRSCKTRSSLAVARAACRRF